MMQISFLFNHFLPFEKEHSTMGHPVACTSYFSKLHKVHQSLKIWVQFQKNHRTMRHPVVCTSYFSKILGRHKALMAHKVHHFLKIWVHNEDAFMQSVKCEAFCSIAIGSNAKVN